MAKKTLHLALILVMLMCSVTCASTEGLTEWLQYVADKEDGYTDMNETLEITWWGFNSNGVLPLDGTDMQKIIEQRFNVKITNVPVDNYNREQVNLLLATGTEYDISTTPASFSERAETGLIRTVSQEMLETYAPTIVGLLKDAVGDSWVNYATYQGEMWGIPQITASWDTPQVLGVRTDWLNAIGYDNTNLPTTIEGLEEMLLKLHTDDPDGNGVEDTYALGMSNSYGFYEMGAFGVARGYWYYNADGELTHYAVDPNYKEALKLMQRWYKLGIYDPEIITDKRADGVAKFADGKIAGYQSLDNCFGRNSSASLSGPRAAIEQGNTDIDITFIPPMEGCKTALYGNTVSASGITFGVNCSDEKLIRLLQIQDTYFSDPELWQADSFGERYVNWDFDEAGNVLKGSENGFEDRKEEAESGFQRFYNFSFIPSTVLAWRLGGVGEYGSRYEIYQLVHDYPAIIPATVSVFATDADLEYGASCDKICDEYFLKCITGENDIDATWDNYVETWLNAGGQAILDAKRKLDASMN